MNDSLRDNRVRNETQISEEMDERMTMNDNKSNTQMKVYAKNSFDRFGDDLNALILSYLTFEDKIRLECVSKQWQRCVYQRQFVIEIFDKESDHLNDVLEAFFFNIELKSKDRHNSLNKLLIMRDNRRQLNVKAFESVLKKCPNIKKVIIEVMTKNQVLSIIGRYCQQIKSLTYHRINPSKREDIVLSFFRTNGHKLEELFLYDSDGVTDDYLKYCTNLKILKLSESSLICNEDKQFLPKLEEIRNSCFNPLQDHFKDINQMKILSDKYSQTMKTLNASLRDMTEEELKTCIECIARFENLKELKLEFGINKSIDDYISLIGQKCSKLLKLDLLVNPSVLITDRFFDLFSKFKNIKKLKLRLHNNTEVKGSIESLKHCKQLKHLDIEYFELREEFFANIDSFVPKLQTLRIFTSRHFSDSFIDSFHSMKNIQNVNLFIEILPQMSSSKKYWYFGKSLSEVMLNPNGKNVIRVTDNCGLLSYHLNY